MGLRVWLKKTKDEGGSFPKLCTKKKSYPDLAKILKNFVPVYLLREKKNCPWKNSWETLFFCKFLAPWWKNDVGSGWQINRKTHSPLNIENDELDLCRNSNISWINTRMNEMLFMYTNKCINYARWLYRPIIVNRHSVKSHLKVFFLLQIVVFVPVAKSTYYRGNRHRDEKKGCWRDFVRVFIPALRDGDLRAHRVNVRHTNEMSYEVYYLLALPKPELDP